MRDCGKGERSSLGKTPTFMLSAQDTAILAALFLKKKNRIISADNLRMDCAGSSNIYIMLFVVNILNKVISSRYFS